MLLYVNIHFSVGNVAHNSEKWLHIKSRPQSTLSVLAFVSVIGPE